MYFLPRFGLVFDTPRNDYEFAGVGMNIVSTKMNNEVTFDNEKEFVSILVVMPNKLAF